MQGCGDGQAVGDQRSRSTETATSPSEVVDAFSGMEPPNDSLLLVVMGPGMGESILVGWPPNSWLVVDSFCRTSGATEAHPAVDALEAFGGALQAVALTHPHEDHVRGFASLIERLAADGKVGWWPSAVTSGGRWSTSNAAFAQRNGANEQAVAAIHRAWSELPSSKWELIADQPAISLGDASIEVLTPLHETIEEHRSLKAPDINELSSAMRLTWYDCAVLLGADLVNSRGWDKLESSLGALAFATSAAMKIAHHGSLEAQHPVALGTAPTPGRTLVGSPYNRGEKVPAYRDGEEVELILGVSADLYMSGHHGARPPDCGTETVSRSSLRPAVLDLSGGIGAVTLDAIQPSVDECWFATRLDATGALLSIDRGPGSLHVTS